MAYMRDANIVIPFASPALNLAFTSSKMKTEALRRQLCPRPLQEEPGSGDRSDARQAAESFGQSIVWKNRERLMR
jgi:hypothetical protein